MRPQHMAHVSACEVWGAHPTAGTVVQVAGFSRPGVLVWESKHSLLSPTTHAQHDVVVHHLR